MPATQQSSPAVRVSGFLAHLRFNGFLVGPEESIAVARFLALLDAPDSRATRLGLKTMLSGGRDEWERFDDLFDAYWFGRGIKQATLVEDQDQPPQKRPGASLWGRRLPVSGEAQGTALGQSAGEVEAEEGSDGLIASRRDSLERTDLRRLVSPQDIAEAEEIAARLARALRYRLSRRRKAARRGRGIDLRRTIRRSLPRGGEALDLARRRRPLKPVNLVVLVDVSGSMRVYSRFFLSFLRGLLGQDIVCDAYLFHTRLVRITEVFREQGVLRAVARLSLIAEGFGGGTRIAASLKTFNERYAQQAINSRSVVIIMSDGYDTDPPEALAAELARLKKRARRLVWLNPLIGWRDYEPTARGMAAAMPYIDHFARAHDLHSLAALEADLAAL